MTTLTPGDKLVLTYINGNLQRAFFEKFSDGRILVKSLTEGHKFSVDLKHLQSLKRTSPKLTLYSNELTQERLIDSTPQA